MQMAAIGLATRARVTRRCFLALVASSLGSALASAVTGCRPQGTTRTTPPPAPASRLGKRPATSTPQPTALPSPSPPATEVGDPSIWRLVSGGIERGDPGRAVQIFGFDLDTAREVLFPVTKRRALPAGYAPSDLVSAGTYGVPGGKPVRSIMGADLAAMQRAAGGALSIVSGYRSYDYQVGLFERYVAQQMAAGLDRSAAIERVNRSSALPGHSEHQLGLAIDFNSVDDAFAQTRIGRWLYDEAWRYGFVLSYTPKGEALSGYQYEPWHYRWVGRPLARLLEEQGYLEDDERTPADYYEAISTLLAEA